jgi:hypothetical protein
MKESGCIALNGLPDSGCTPGAVFPNATAAQICRSGYSSSVRDVPAEVSRMVYADYGIAARSPGEYEVDHLVPLELGGSNDIANLWPQEYEELTGSGRTARPLVSWTGVHPVAPTVQVWPSDQVNRTRQPPFAEPGRCFTNRYR